MKYLNLGCGGKFHKDWINADIAPRDKSVLKCNFLKGLPFESDTFDVVYHSHILEHMTKPDGEKFINECVRVLKKGGVIRIVTPNLERIAKEYLSNLERARNQEANAENDYNWILLEMYDQTVRNYPGGMMQEYLTTGTVPNQDYVQKRIGLDVSSIKSNYLPNSRKEKIKRFLKRLTEKSHNTFLQPIIHYIVGKYRFMGEVHLWLYDSYSLSVLLKKAGCDEIQVRSATTSYIMDWENYNLDNPNETASIFIEARKNS
jgi:predicted SAM-dependent methyltransferase